MNNQYLCCRSGGQGAAMLMTLCPLAMELWSLRGPRTVPVHSGPKKTDVPGSDPLFSPLQTAAVSANATRNSILESRKEFAEKTTIQPFIRLVARLPRSVFLWTASLAR